MDHPLSPASVPEGPGDTERMPEEVKQEVHGHHGIAALRLCIETGPAEVRKTTHLELVIDSSTWNDYLDDDLAMLINEFAPLSENLQRLTITIRGNTYFTRCNYIKPVITHRVAETGAHKDDEDDAGFIKEEPDSDDGGGLNDGEDAKALPVKKVRFARTARDPIIDNNKDSPDIKGVSRPNKERDGRFKPHTKSFTEIDYHVSDKNFIAFLLKLHKPIPIITIQGPMEISFRRYIIENLNPGWSDHPHCVAQMGQAEADRARVGIASNFETNMTVGMKRIGPADDQGKQDVNDFGLGSKMSLESVNRYGMGNDWIVPTGKAGRVIMGWKAVAGKTWRGPV